MTINSIGASLALLASSVKPVEPATPALTPTGQPAPLPVKLEGKLNTFALAVLAVTLESEQGLLDNNNPGDSQAGQTVVGAAVSLATVQQATSAYKAAQLIGQDIPSTVTLTA